MAAAGRWRRWPAATGRGDSGEAVGERRKKNGQRREKGDDTRVSRLRVLHVNKTALQNHQMVKNERF
jgi:hypothetical protein